MVVMLSLSELRGLGEVTVTCSSVVRHTHNVWRGSCGLALFMRPGALLALDTQQIADSTSLLWPSQGYARLMIEHVVKKIT
jgi:hypothetical protein